MKRAVLLCMLVMSAAGIGTLFLFSGNVAAQDNNNNKKDTTPTPYNPYPPGILPPDLVSEIARVRREVATIENQALAEWRALTPPTLTGQPPFVTVFAKECTK
jgi:hypothetical protein